MTPPESETEITTMFDRYIVVDWSANSTPKRGPDSIWIASIETTGRSWSLNVPTRRQAIAVLLKVITDEPARTLLGVDFSLGFPQGTAAAIGLTGTPWSAMWALLADMVDDDVRNRNNRFDVASRLNARCGPGPGPFWGAPPSQRTPSLTSTKVGPAPMSTWRSTEATLRDAGHRPFSCWQLLGAGAVGSQSLLGIAALRRLVGDLATADVPTHVWPFTTGLGPPAVPTDGVIVAEIWPSMIPVDDAGRVRDEAQVITTGQALAALDDSRHLDELFAPAVPVGARDSVMDEEGWILGAGTAFSAR